MTSNQRKRASAAAISWPSENARLSSCGTRREERQDADAQAVARSAPAAPAPSACAGAERRARPGPCSCPGGRPCGSLRRARGFRAMARRRANGSSRRAIAHIRARPAHARPCRRARASGCVPRPRGSGRTDQAARDVGALARFGIVAVHLLEFCLEQRTEPLGEAGNARRQPLIERCADAIELLEQFALAMCCKIAARRILRRWPGASTASASIQQSEVFSLIVSRSATISSSASGPKATTISRNAWRKLARAWKSGTRSHNIAAMRLRGTRAPAARQSQPRIARALRPRGRTLSPR